jgi:hypothetical protein
MPSEQANHDEGDDQVKHRVGGGYSAFNEEGECGDLEQVSDNGYGPGQALLWLFQRAEGIFEVI